MPKFRAENGFYIVNSWDDVYNFCGVGFGKNARAEAWQRLMAYQNQASRQHKLEGYTFIQDQEEVSCDEFEVSILRRYARTEATTFIPDNVEYIVNEL